MRVFIAIELEDEAKDYLSKMQKTAKEHSKGGNFSRKENLHLTVRFIGEVTSEELEKIKGAMVEAAKEMQSFFLYTDKLGFFPRKNKIILWVGIKGNAVKLQELYNITEGHLTKIGLPGEEKNYNPHLTLGREIVLNSNIDLLEKELKLEEKKIVVNKLSLMESKRENGRLVYKPIYVVTFNHIV